MAELVAVVHIHSQLGLCACLEIRDQFYSYPPFSQTIYMLLWPAFTYTYRGLPESDVHVSPTPAHIQDPVTYRPPSSIGKTTLDEPPMYPDEGEPWAEMKSPIS